jgi:ABC-type molybdate transport system permease subunit
MFQYKKKFSVLRLFVLSMIALLLILLYQILPTLSLLHTGHFDRQNNLKGQSSEIIYLPFILPNVELGYFDVSGFMSEKP